MQTPTDGAVLTQGNLEAAGRLASRPGVIPVPVKDVWTIGNPFEPKTATADYDAYHNTWIPRDPANIYIVTNQTILTKGISGGFGGPIGGSPLLTTDTPYIPGHN